jgi:membrane-bound metal-dependent hydrolase YbcI (DUF457 family)
VDNITHSLFALTLANAGLRRPGRGATAALVVASNIPDIEVLTTLTGGRVGYLAAHRGASHGPFSLLLGVGVAGAVWAAQRLRGRRPADAAGFWSLVAVSLIGIAGHVALDFATSYGTRVLSPFAGTWYGVDWMPIIDGYLLLLLVAGLAATAVVPARRAAIAAVVLVLMAGDYGFRATAHHVALEAAVARQQAALPGAGRPAQPGTVFHYLGTAHRSALPAALPTLGSPLRWRLITRTAEGYEVSEVNLLSPGRATDVLTFPDQSGPLVARASTAPLARVFLGFSRFPAAETIHHRGGDVTVHWYDLRFAQKPAVPGDGHRPTSPFAVWVRVSPTGAIVGQGLGPG